MTRALLALLPLALALPAAAQAPPPVGARWRVTGSEKREVNEARTREGDAAPIADARAVQVESVVVVEVAATSSSAVTAWRFTVERWSRRDLKSGKSDASLEGATGTIDALTGALREEPAPATPRSGPPQAWLKRLGVELSAKAPRARALRPAPDARTGERAKAPDDVRLLLEGQGELDHARSTAFLTVVARDAARLEVQLEARFQLATLPGTDARITDGGVYAVTETVGWPAGLGPGVGSLASSQRFQGKASGKEPDGTALALEVSATLERAQSAERISNQKEKS